MRRGFTIVELIIVLVTIGVLAAVAIPAFMDYVELQKAQEQALEQVKKATRLSNHTMKNICVNGHTYTRVVMGEERYLVLTLDSFGNAIKCNVKPAERQD